MGVVTPTTIRDHCLAPERVDAPVGDGGRYGRMFDLPALEADETLLHRIGAAGGFCDGGDCKGDAGVEAGWPFFGQYVAHDLTADRSPLRAHTDLESLRNMRSPRANLESLYGGGPGGSPYMYAREDPSKLLTGEGDLPRNHEGIAIIGDPRNDVHAFMSQMQLRFLQAHNALVDRVGDFEEARRRLTWHYQQVILDEFLPVLVGRELVADVVANGPRFYRPPDGVYIPVEFADAAYRYGHSQIRQYYRLQDGGPLIPVFPDLIGFRPIEDRRIDWSLLFDVPGRSPAQRAKPMDGVLPTSLIQLPQAINGAVEQEAYRSLAVRDLERGQGTGLPSGESVARAMGVEPLSKDELDLERHGWAGDTPLWLYVLRESSVLHGGDRLGEVGGRIVAEVLVEIVRRDPESYLAVEPEWTPTTFRRLTDILVP